MTEFSTSLVEPEAPELSTQLDAPRPSDETVDAKPPVEAEKKAPESRLDAIKRAADDVAPKEPEKVPEAKAEPVAKPEPTEPPAKEDPKPAPVEQERRQPKDHIEPPKSFQPKTKEVWVNTPRDVKVEVQRLVTEHEQEITKHREATERYEGIRQYDEAARSNGRDLKDSLARVVEIENAIQANPIAGLNRILQEIGPRKPDGQAFSLYEVAAHIVQAGPDGYQRMVAQQQQPAQQQRQPDPEVLGLKQQLATMQQQMTAAQVIEPFRAANPRYDELQDEIAFFLESGKVPASLSPSERLAAAYDLAVRISPQAQRQPAPIQQETEALSASRAGDDFGGTKSVRGAPASGVETTNSRRGKLSRGDSIKAAMAELGIAN